MAMGNGIYCALAMMLSLLTMGFSIRDKEDPEALIGEFRQTNRYKALIIGVSEYRSPEISGVSASTAGAARIADLLKTEYGFETTALLNAEADKNGILAALERLAATATEKDSILIFFSGSGAFDRTGNYGWWLPWDATPDNFMDRLDNHQILEFISQMKARHILLVSDSAFAPSLIETSAAEDSATIYQQANARPSRQLLGISESAPKTGKKTGFTDLADLLISRLAKTDAFIFGLRDIADDLAEAVKKECRIAPLRNVGHEGGDFIWAAANLGQLLVDTDPLEAEVRILNIKPAYRRGMMLKAGKYQLQVSATGHDAVKEWVTVKSNAENLISIRLPVKRESQPTISEIENSLGMKFVLIREGAFLIGSPDTEHGRKSDEQQSRFKIAKRFYLQQTEVTVGQWKRFIKDSGYLTEAEKDGGAWIRVGANWVQQEKAYWNSPHYEQTDNHPVTCVSWNDAKMFIDWLNQKEKLGYRLPTEVEWEYACRAGTQTPFSFGACLTSRQANFYGKQPLTGCPESDFLLHPKPVRSYPANPWKLYEMHGNVWEWCSDQYTVQPGVQVLSSQQKGYRVCRGGAWDCPARFCRSAFRMSFTPHLRFNNLGFRLARDAD